MPGRRRADIGSMNGMAKSAVGAPVTGAGASPAGVGAERERAALLALGRAGQPWEFAARAGAWLARVAGEADGREDELRLLLAATYARLGLATAAGEVLARMSELAASDPNVPRLAAHVAQMPGDRVSAAELMGNVRANVAAMLSRAGGDGGGVVDAPGLAEAAAAWCRRVETGTSGREWFRAAGGVIVRRRVSSPTWERLIDDAALEAQTRAGLGGGGGGGGGGGAMPPAFVVEGLGSPRLVAALASLTPTAPDGRQTAFWIVDEDLAAVVEGLALADVSAVLAQPRVRLVLGPGAGERLAAHWRGRLGLRLSAAVVPTPGCEPRAGAILSQVLAEQTAAMETATREVAQVYGGRDARWWAQRYRAALTGRACGEVTDTSPLRVLVPTCRYSTFIRHSSADIAAAVEAAGMKARVLIEPDDASQLSLLATVREVAEFEPDLVVLINYPRSTLGGSVPKGVPFVCWVQDPMPHLFDRATGAAQGPLDFVMGHLHATMFETFSWPRERAMACPVLVSREKFHDGDVEPGLRERLACDIACATNHSQTPGQLRDELIEQARRAGPEGATTVGAVEALYEEITARARRPHGSWLDTALDPPIHRVIAELGLPDDAKTHATLFNNVARPLADRAVRHQALEWAAEIARERGLRLHIYGRGWERHPTLAAFARGQLDHGAELRAAYRCAGVHLHASAGSSLHQRIMECFLSGGVCLIRTKLYDLEPAEAHAAARAVMTGPPDEPGYNLCAGPGCPTYPGARYDYTRHPATLAYAMLRTRMGFPLDARLYMHERQVAGPWDFWGGVPIEPEAANVWGDLWELGFDTAERLADRVERALHDRAWRENVAAGVRGRVARHFTYEGVVPAMIQRVAGALGPTGAS